MDDPPAGAAEPAIPPATPATGALRDASRRSIATSLAICCLVGVIGNVTRAAWWTPWSGFAWNGTALRLTALGAEPVRIGRFRKVLVPVPPWRPMSIVLAVRAGKGGRTLRIESPSAAIRQTIAIGPGAATVTVVARVAGDEDGRIPLYCDVTDGDGEADDVAIEDVAVSPIAALRPLLWYGVSGALWGAAAGGLAMRRRWSPRAETGHAAAEAPAGATRVGRGSALLAAGAVMALFTLWAVLKPPLQAPDEPQHIVRATSMRLTPWAGGAQEFAVDPRHLVTLSWGASPVLDGLIGHPDRYLTRREVDALESQPPVPVAASMRVRSAVASYPPLFYWYVFAASEVCRALALTPWQTLYALRIAVALLAACVWAGVFTTLRRPAGGLAVHAGTALAVMVATPTYTYLASSVNPDAVVVPLAVWLALLCWQSMAAGAGSNAIGAVAVALLLTKPSGIQVIAGFTLAALAFAWRYRSRALAAFDVAGTLVFCGLTIYAVYYAWTPPALSDGDGLRMSIAEYFAALPARIPDLWIMLWGNLGWLEYQAPRILYLAPLAVVGAWIVWIGRARRDDLARGALLFFGVAAAVLVVSTFAGEYARLSRTGYMLQGRYFLPALVCLVPFIARGPAPLRIALAASVALLHVTLAWLTFVRYWHADLGTWLASLPF